MVWKMRHMASKSVGQAGLMVMADEVLYLSLDLTDVHVRRGFRRRTVSPRASMATSSAFFLARPAGVFIALMRNARAKRFCLLRVRKVRRARGFASMAARRSTGTVSSVASRMGA